MWVTEDGLAHTVAPPDWRRVVSVQGQLDSVADGIREVDVLWRLDVVEALAECLAEVEDRGDGPRRRRLAPPGRGRTAGWLDPPHRRRGLGRLGR